MKKVKMMALAIAAIVCANTISAQTMAHKNMKETTVEVGGAPMYPSKNIVENAVNSKDHTTLVAAVKAAGLVETLMSAGPFTVFAPTNAAFEKLPEGTVESLLKPESKDALRNILEYHVYVGVLTENIIQDGMKLNQVNLENVVLNKKDGKITVNGANVLGSARGSNGIVYIIDQVLIPPPAK